MEAKYGKEGMTKKERCHALLGRKPVDRVALTGYAGGFAAINVGYTIKDIYTDPVKMIDALTWTAEQYDWDGSIGFGDMALVPPHFFFRPGKEVKMPEGEYAQAPIIKRFMIESVEEAMAFQMPSAREVSPLSLKGAEIADKAGFYYIGYIFELMSLAANLPGVETFCKWMMKKPDIAHKLMRQVTDFALDMVKLFTDTYDAGRIIPFHGEPTASNQVISPDMFEKFMLPYLKEFYEKIQAMGIKHAIVHPCGEQNENLPFWAQVKMGDPAVITFGHEIDIETASKYFPNDIIMGNIEPAIIQTGKPQEVYDAARLCIEKGKKHPSGFMLAPGCELPPKAPPYNVWQMTKAINDFGRYE